MSSHVEVRTDHRITSAGDAVATPADAQRLHAWPDELASPDEPVRWAVMDSGIHADLVENHPWFESVTIGKRFDATGAGTGGDAIGHGSACASIIARNTPAVELWSVRIFGDSGQTNGSIIRDAYEWLLDNADALDGVNMSWGARQDDPEIDALHERLGQAGVHDVVAAGNTGAEGGSPATADRAFSVGAVDERGDLTRFTSRDPNQDNPDVAAVGKNVKVARAPDTAMGTPIDDQFTKACMPSHTQVLTADGWTTIRAIHQRKELPLAVTYNTQTGEFEKNEITRTLRREMETEESLYRVSTDEGHYIEATGNHRLLTSRGYVRADRITTGDEIITFPNTSVERKTPLLANERHVHECKECGTRCLDDNENRIYCSKSCKGGDASRFPDTTGKNNPNYKPRAVVTCEHCGTEEQVPPARAREYRFCSLECFGKHRSNQDSTLNDSLTKWREEHPEAQKQLADLERFVQQQGNWETLPHDSESARKGALAAHQKVLSQSIHDETELEAAVREMLDVIGVEYEQEYIITRDNGGLLTAIDFAIPERNIAIYADGDYWHNYPDGTDRDERITEALESRGWEVIRLWESDVTSTPDKVKQELSKAVTNGAEVINVEEVEKKPVYDITTEPNHNFVANGLVVHNSGTSFAAPYTSAAYVNALAHARQSWDRAFERVAPDIPGTKADGEGRLELAPALDQTGGATAATTTDGTVVRFDGHDTLFLDADWLPDGDVTASKLDDTDTGVDLRIRR